MAANLPNRVKLYQPAAAGTRAFAAMLIADQPRAN